VLLQQSKDKGRVQRYLSSLLIIKEARVSESRQFFAMSSQDQIPELDVLLVGAGFGAFTLMNK
jgi:hypothetical protein